jgi:dTMP kinase
MKKRGLLYVLEGPDFFGKDTQMDLLSERLKNEGYPIIVTKEPGSEHETICQKIRELLLDVKNEGMDPLTELFLYLADRSQHTKKVINPALERGEIVLTSRYRRSTEVYQGIVRGLGHPMTVMLNNIATGGMQPDLEVFLDGNPEEVYAARGVETLDRIEKQGLEFQIKVRDGYRQVAKVLPNAKTVSYIKNGREEMHGKIYLFFKEHLEQNGKNINRK